MEEFPWQNSHQLLFSPTPGMEVLFFPYYSSPPSSVDQDLIVPKQKTSRTQWLTLIAGVGHWDTSNGLSCCWTRCQPWPKSRTPGKHQSRKVIMQTVIQSLLTSQGPYLCLRRMGGNRASPSFPALQTGPSGPRGTLSQPSFGRNDQNEELFPFNLCSSRSFLMQEEGCVCAC